MVQWLRLYIPNAGELGSIPGQKTRSYVCVCARTCVHTCVHVHSVTQSCPTFCDPMACSHQAPLSMEFARQEYWSGLPFPPPGDLPDPGIKPVSPALQADSLLSEPQGSPRSYMLQQKLKIICVETKTWGSQINKLK